MLTTRVKKREAIFALNQSICVNIVYRQRISASMPGRGDGAPHSHPSILRAATTLLVSNAQPAIRLTLCIDDYRCASSSSTRRCCRRSWLSSSHPIRRVPIATEHAMTSNISADVARRAYLLPLLHAHSSATLNASIFAGGGVALLAAAADLPAIHLPRCRALPACLTKRASPYIRRFERSQYVFDEHSPACCSAIRRIRGRRIVNAKYVWLTQTSACACPSGRPFTRPSLCMAVEKRRRRINQSTAPPTKMA